MSLLDDNPVELLTARFSSVIITDPRPETLCGFEQEGADWLLRLRIQVSEHRCELFELPVHDGEPEGEFVDVAPGVRSWGAMRYYGLARLGPGVWRLDPSLYVPGGLHAFIVLCDVPDPAPFARSILFSARGERLPARYS
jgi:hypothetical protein